MKNTYRFMRKLFGCLFVLITLSVVICLFFISQVKKSHDNPFGQRDFEIMTGESVETISNNLRDQGFINSTWSFNLYARLTGKSMEFKAGHFSLNTTMSIEDIIAELTKKKAGKAEIKITTLEGWNNSEIAEYLASKELFSAADFLEYLENFSDGNFDFLEDKPREAGIEGYLYPDTYQVYEDAIPDDIITKMLVNFGRKLTPELRAEIKRQNKTIFEVLTLASIVEKEMFGYENRQIIAGIFLARLADNYPLQSDATVNYITKKGTTRPSLDDTKLDNPYNTYKNAGLPPGPICNPSIEAIRAVIYPKKTDYYFFLTTPDSEIIYSRNHEEHILNRNKYLK